MKAAIYCRVSSDEQTKGASLDVQEERGRAFAEFQQWEVVGIYSDPGISALSTSPLARPGFADAASSRADVILVYDWTRFSRNQPLGEMDYRTLQERGVRIVSVTEPGDDPFMRGIHLLMAEKVARDTGKKSRESKERRAKEGLWGGGPPPFGHQVVDRRLVVNEAEAATIRRAAQLLAKTGTTLAEVAQVLNDEGRLPRRKNPQWEGERDKKWTSDSLRRILGLESLVGKYTWGKQGKEQVAYEIPAILDQRTFASLQAHLKATSRKGNRVWHVYPLSGRLISPCGLAYTGAYSSRGDVRYYRCQGMQAKPYCGCSFLRADDVEKKVWWEIVPLLEDPQRLLELTGLDKEDDQTQADDAVRMLDAKISNLDQAITERAADALAAGFSPDRIAKVVGYLENELHALHQKRAKAASWEDTARDRKERRKRIISLAREGPRLTRAAFKVGMPTLEFQKTLHNLLDVRATVAADGIKIRGTLREDLPFLLNIVPATVSRRR